ncbi:MAG: hypothetical protein DRQ48_09430, partial [Gammaproteobacteria bacterium]
MRTENVFLAALLVTTTLLLVHQGWLWRLDQFIYDAQLKIWQHPPSDDIVIITIDETSFDILGNWPWPSSYYTSLLSQLAQDNPRAVSFYFPLSLAYTVTQKPDTKLFEVLTSVKNTALSVQLESYADILAAGELSDYLSSYSIATTGHINVVQDQGGVVRSAHLAVGTPSRIWNNLNLQITGQAYENPVTGSDHVKLQPLKTLNKPQVFGYDRILIPFAGPPGHFQHIPFYKILSGETFPGQFNNKYVLIGITDTRIGKSYPTPNNGFFNPMPLVEINANILDSILNNIFIQPATHSWNLAFSGIFALLPFFIYPFFTPRGNVVTTLILIAITLAISLILILYFHLWLPPTAALLAVVLSFLLWSSRRLANAVHSLNTELTELNIKKADFETAIFSRLDSVFSFLKNIMPIAGWQILDGDGRFIAGEGNPPELSNKQFIRNRWSDDGIDYWTSLTINQAENRIGLRWSNSRGPSAAEKDYLDRLLNQLSDKLETDEHNSHEVVQNLILQVQEAIINLRNTHKFLDDSLAHMADGVLVTSKTGNILLLNNRAATYLQADNKEELAGKDISQLLNRLTLEGNAKINDLLSESFLKDCPVSTHASNEAGQDLLLQVTPLSRSNGNTEEVIFNLSDISHLKSVERARNETLSFVSHDLRSPLVSILALLELAKNREPSEEIQILHKRIEEYTQLTINLAEQFTQLARVESDASIKFETIDLVSTAINAHEQAWVQAQAKDIHMVREIDLDHAWVRGDSGLLERAVTNLLNNAIKYSAKGSTVSMEIFCKNDHIWCCVEDEGYGIPENELP